MLAVEAWGRGMMLNVLCLLLLPFLASKSLSKIEACLANVYVLYILRMQLSLKVEDDAVLNFFNLLCSSAFTFP